MGDIYKSYYDVVRLSHNQEKLFKNKHCQFVLSSETSTLQRSKSTEENLHDIFVIDTAAAVPDDLLETIHQCAGKQGRGHREKVKAVLKKFGGKRRSQSYSEGSVRKSRSTCELFDLTSIEDMEETTLSRNSKGNGPVQNFSDAGDVTEGSKASIDEKIKLEGEKAKFNEVPSSCDVIEGSDTSIYGHPEEKAKKGKDGTFHESVQSTSSSTDEIKSSYREPDKIITKTRIISCQSDDSGSFEESKKFLSDSDISHGTANAMHQGQRSASLENISKLLNEDVSNYRLACADVEEHTTATEISGSCSAYRSKDSIISKLEAELRESFKLLAEKDAEVKAICADKEGDGWQKYAEKEEENTKLRKDMIELKAECSRLHALYHQTVTSLEKAKADVTTLKAELEEREKYHERTYLKMYEKGQKAALIEREQQLEELASQNPQSVSTQELLDKLNHTQSELGRWQTLARQESYESANKPKTESDAVLQFMKDCMFHYLTDKEDCGLHLRAMVRMLRFTDQEKRKMIQIRRKVKKQSAEYFSGVLLNP